MHQRQRSPAIELLISDNLTPTSVQKFNSESTKSKDPILDFFMERYDVAYKNELDRFIDCINSRESPDVTFEDGRSALIIANAAYESLENKKSLVQVKLKNMYSLLFPLYFN